MPRLAFILPLIAMLTKEPEMLQPDAFCEHTMQQNATLLLLLLLMRQALRPGRCLDPAGPAKNQ